MSGGGGQSAIRLAHRPAGPERPRPSLSGDWLARSWPASALLSRGRFANLLDRRVQKGPSEVGVVDHARQHHRTDHRRQNGHGLALGLLVIRLGNQTAEDSEVFL